ncbi:filamentous hemagglutinin N-terminal domain-containing protein [Erwinia sp. J316]|uniref:Filamentous hemagglutinin N-terminal domain-containing protein n=2 Tax=Erwinia sorbitola TaxID=2681984 RepID=A0ABW9RA27_9GAMM|nr:filamentous hemagglutinin N-terminal domain-containing protein [Erwinia sorbitola]
MTHLYQSKRTSVMKMKTIALNPMALAVAIAFTASAHAAGTGTIVSGNGSISQNQNHTVVKQNTDKMVINWDNMDVAQKEILQFVQPGKNSAVLNRINSHDPTQINGALRANGQVFIVNPNGVLINNGASIDVGSLIASSLDIQDSDFMKGNLTFSGNGTGTVSNQGTISAESSVALIGAGEVNNKGTITTVKGGATLAAGEDITLSFPSMGLISVKINKGSLRALVNNGGIIRTPNGSIALTAWATDTLTRSVINNTGTLEADQIVMRTDGVYLDNIDSAQAGDINIAGTVTGNTIHASGSNIKINQNASVIASKNINLDGKNVHIDGDASSDTLKINADTFSQGTNSSLSASTANFYGGDFDLSSGKTDLENINVWNANSLNLHTNSYTDLGYSELATNLNVVSTADVALKNVYVGGSAVIEADNIRALPSPYGSFSSLFSTEDITLRAKNNIDLKNISAINKTSIKTGGNLTLDVLAGRDINVDSTGSVNFKGIHSDGTLNIVAQQNFNTSGNIYSKSDMTISARNIKNAESWGSNTIKSDGNITLTAKENIHINDVIANAYTPWVKTISDVSLSAKNITANIITTEGKVNLNAENNLHTEMVKYASDINLKAGGKIQTGELQSRGAITIAAEGDVNLMHNVTADNDLIINGDNINAYQYNWMTPVIKSQKNITLTAKNDINVHQVISESYRWNNYFNGNVHLSGKNIFARSVESLGDATVNATNNVVMHTIYANNVDISTTGNIDVSNVYGFDSVNATSTDGNIRFNYLAATRHKNLTASKGVNINYDGNRYQSSYSPWY